MKTIIAIVLLLLLHYSHAFTCSSSSSSNSNRYATLLKSRLITIDEAKESLKQWNDASSLIKYDTIDSETFTISENDVGNSVADYLSKRCNYLGTKSRVHKVCRLGLVLRNGGLVYSSAKLLIEDVLTIDKRRVLEELKDTNTLSDLDLTRLVSYTNSLLSENQNPCFHTIYEDNNLAVVFKPAGVHSLRWTGTMKRRMFALGISYRVIIIIGILILIFISTIDECLPLLLKAPFTNENNNINEDISLPRPIPQHRLDARVAGCLVVAKSRKAAVNLHQQFEQRIVKKEYRAILVGKINTDDPRKVIVIKDPIDGLPSSTELIIMQETKCPVYGYLTTVRLFPLTGRRHQLRRHCAALGNPIVGDNLYHAASYASSSHAQRLIAIQIAADSTKSATEIINAKKQIDMDDDLNFSGNDSDIDEITTNNDEENEKILIEDSDRKDIPALRKGSMYLMAIAVEMQLPFNKDKILRVEAEELPRFKRIIEKAVAGYKYNNPGVDEDTAVVSYA